MAASAGIVPPVSIRIAPSAKACELWKKRLHGKLIIRRIRLTQVYTIYGISTKGVYPPNFISRYRSNRDSVLNQAEKQLSARVRFSSIKSESELVQIIIQMGRADCSLMCAEQPSLQEGCPTVYQWQEVFSDISRLTDNGMFIRFRRQVPIASPPISPHQTVGFHTLFDGHHQTIRRGIGNSFKAYAPDLLPFIFNGNQHQGFPRGASPSFSRSLAANIGFIYFYGAGKTFSTGSHHGHAQFMKPNPNSFVPFKTQHSLESLSADSIFLTNYIPDSPEPELQWFSGILKDSASDKRGLIAAISAMEQFTLG